VTKHWLVLFLSVNFYPSAFAQQTTEQLEWYVPYESSPLKVSLLANRFTLALTNNSEGVVLRYEIGCVSKSSRKVILGSVQTTSVSLNPKQSSFGNLDGFAELIDKCKKLHSLVPITSVSFADGSYWTATGAASCDSPKRRRQTKARQNVPAVYRIP
jgi:hypothetical protein